MHSVTLVFDLDDTICLHLEQDTWQQDTEEVVQVYGEKFRNQHMTTALDYPHFIFPGFSALWKWLYAQGHNIVVFSSAVKERNVEFVDRFVELTFGEQAREIRPRIRIFSREDCFDTRDQSKDQSQYQPIFFGNRKKVLADIVVQREELPWTLLIDDDRSYMALGEEDNYIRVETGISLHIVSGSDQDHRYFFKAFYLAGLLSQIFAKMKESQLTAAEAAKYFQITSEKQDFDARFFYPSLENPEYYKAGEQILQTIDPTLVIHSPYLKG